MHKDAPIALKDAMNVRINRLDEKAVTDVTCSGRMTHASLSSAFLVISEKVQQWENLKLEILDNQMNPLAGDVYGKVVSVTEGNGSYDAVVRFTSIGREAYLLLRKNLTLESHG